MSNVIGSLVMEYQQRPTDFKSVGIQKLWGLKIIIKKSLLFGVVGDNVDEKEMNYAGVGMKKGRTPSTPTTALISADAPNANTIQYFPRKVLSRYEKFRLITKP